MSLDKAADCKKLCMIAYFFKIKTWSKLPFFHHIPTKKCLKIEVLIQIA